MLTYADSLTYAHVCSRTLPYADEAFVRVAPPAPLGGGGGGGGGGDEYLESLVSVPPLALRGVQGTQFTQFTCLTGIKVQILTLRGVQDRLVSAPLWSGGGSVWMRGGLGPTPAVMPLEAATLGTASRWHARIC